MRVLVSIGPRIRRYENAMPGGRLICTHETTLDNGVTERGVLNWREFPDERHRRGYWSYSDACWRPQPTSPGPKPSALTGPAT